MTWERINFTPDAARYFGRSYDELQPLKGIDDMELQIRQGREQPNAKLSEDAVREIRDLRGVESQGSLANRFGVSQQQIKQVQLLRAWRHVR